MIKKCLNCGEEKKHYARGLCRNCYARAIRCDYNLDELKKHDKEMENKRRLSLKKKKRLDLFHTTPLGRIPCGDTSRMFYDWYYKTSDDSMTMTFNNIKERDKAYGIIYAMTKRRHNVPVNIKRRKLTMTIERRTL